MDRQQFDEWLGLSDDDATVHHRRFLFQHARYTAEELAGFYEFWTGLLMLLEAPRETMLERFRHYLPHRRESDFVAIMQAFWDDGVRGPLIAEMLGREPEEPGE